MQKKNVSFYLTLLLSGWLFFTPTQGHINRFDAGAVYEVYFTPGHDCTAQIVRTIKSARNTVYVQAYFMTSEPIVSALLDAKLNGVEVKVVLDKNHPENQKGVQKMLEMDIPVWIDYLSGIAHNKVMIIDEVTVITGSFNFTYSANHRNRENLLVIRDRQLAQHYLRNWYSCQARSKQEVPLRKPAKKPQEKQSLNEVEKLLAAIVRFVRNMLEVIGVIVERV